MHRDDSFRLAVTGKYILKCGMNEVAVKQNNTSKNLSNQQASNSATKKIPSKLSKHDASSNNANKKRDSGVNTQKIDNNILAGGTHIKRREKNRVRCAKCEGCKRERCNTCSACVSTSTTQSTSTSILIHRDCEKQRCLRPKLCTTAFCSICKLDGWMGRPSKAKKELARTGPPNLFECIICFDITHPHCAEKTIGSGEINPDLANSWLCNRCTATSTKMVAKN